jgi:hypothetical protein
MGRSTSTREYLIVVYQYCDVSPPMGRWQTQAGTVSTLKAHVSQSFGIVEGN